MERYASVVIWLFIVYLVFGIWRLLTKRSRPGPAAAGMMHEILSDDGRAAIEIIVEERTGYRDPENRDGSLAEHFRGRIAQAQTAAGGDAGASAWSTSPVDRAERSYRMGRVPSSFYRGAIAGVMALAVLWGLGALLADMTAAVPSYIRSAAILNVVGGLVGFSVMCWREQRPNRRTLHP
jgi:hypothetical protein